MAENAVAFKIELEAWGHTIEATTRIPRDHLRIADLLPILYSFDDAVIGIGASAANLREERISCRAGCGACCRQLVPISEPEAYYLAELIDSMPAERQSVIRERFRETLEALERHGLLNELRKSSALKEPDRIRVGEAYLQLRLPCPLLEDELCSIYPYRPMSCREYLVASPAENCRNPTPENISRVPLPVKFSEILYTFRLESVRWLPLALAPEWVRQNQQPPPTAPAPELFREFLTIVSAVARRSDQTE
jgi:Fe-S-cluster containining protein